MKSDRLKKIWNILGPGLITGASDDDPSGIATYSQAGAKYGITTLWTALITFPLMAAMQGMCARIGIVTSTGLAGILKKYYSKPVLYTMLVFSCPAIILNISADIAGMGAVTNLLFPRIPAGVFCVLFTFLILVSIIYYPYVKIAAILKYLCISLLVYLIVPFFTRQNFGEIAHATFIPTLKFDKDFFAMLVAILGTTISPYLFFWQASLKVENSASKKTVIVDKAVLNNMRKDTNFGMFFSNLIMYFIILTAGTVLFRGGINQIDTVEQAAKALEPLAGKWAYLLFAVGVIGTGFLAIPVLGGSVSYIVSETFGWKEGLNKKFSEARSFYIIIIISLVAGLLMDYVGLSPVKALYYTAVLYGITAPVIIAIVLFISNNPRIMGAHTNSRLSNVLGIMTLILMTIAAGFLVYLEVAG